jgi:acyl-CoA synthetase (AMP-forming)/AMP-acid ligase II
MATIAERFLGTAARVPDHPFLVAAYSPSLERLTYGEAARRAWSFAAHLRAAGVEPGDRLVLNCPNSLDYLCAYFGSWLAGATILPLDHRSRPAHVSHVFHDSGARYVVVPTAHRHLDAAIPQLSLADVEWTSAAPEATAHIPENDLALIIYTSGTTGMPKGVCLSHETLDHTRAAITSWAQVAADDRELTTLSLTHLFGLAHVHVYAALGGTVYIEDGLRDVPRVLDLIQREAITSFPGTPAGFRIILDHYADTFRQKARTLRYIVINTAPMPVAYTEQLLSVLPETRVYMYYGLTEASRSTYIAYRDHQDKLATVGRPTPGADVCVGDPARPLVNEPGEVLVRGKHVTSGYWRLDSNEFFVDGWFRTGDLGVIDGDGFLTWVGRVREQINVNGLKLVPAEVEHVLRRDARVAECAVVGAPDPLTGETVVAFVVLAGGVADDQLELQLRKLCNKHLELYKVPKRVLFVDAIPKTDSGKVKRFMLRERLEPAMP